MRVIVGQFVTRKRLLIAVLVVVGMIGAAWVFGRHPVARWAVRRVLAQSHLEPASFQIDSVGLGTLRVANLSIGSEPWFTAGSVEVTFTPRDLLSKRVMSVRLADVQWTVQSRDGAIDWGYVAREGGGPAAFNSSCDLVEVTGSVIHVVVNGAEHDVQVAGRLALAGPATAAVQVELAGLGRRATIAAQVKVDGQTLTVGVDGRGEHPVTSGVDVAAAPDPADPAADAPPATSQSRWRGALVRKQAGGATQFDLDLTLDSLVEQAGSVEIGMSQARVTGHAELVEGGLTGLTCSISALGLRAGDLTLQTTELRATKADGPEVKLEIAAKGDGWELPGARGSLIWETTGGSDGGPPRSTNCTAALQTERAVILDFQSAGVTGLVGSISVGARLQQDGSGVHVLDGRVTLDGGSLQAGDVAISDAHAEVVMRDPKSVEVTSLAAIVGDGSTISAEPFAWDLQTPRVQARLTMNNLDLAHWLPIITKSHATGEGRVSGSADVAVDWSAGSAKLGDVKGSFRADPEHGFIQGLDAEALGEMLEKQDPRFATDEVMRPVRDKIIAALRDFAFTQLTVDLSRQGERTIAVTYLSGFGRNGYDPQGLNLTLDLQVQDSFIDLASRIAAKSKVKAAARNALEEFFQEAPAGQEKR